MKLDLCPRVLDLPPFAVVEQEFARPREADVPAAVIRELRKIFPVPENLAGKVVGLTMPSRGIRDIQTVVRTAVAFLKPYCREVRILTAMGTHGGGTAEGEREMAASRGVTEDAVGARVFSNMQTRHIANVGDVEVYVSEDALACDLVLLVNRIKEHTDIDWPVPLAEGCYGLESGFAKILALGISKMRAIEMHKHIPGIGLGAAIEISARRTIGGAELKIAGGLGIVENGADETAEIIGVPVSTVDGFFAIEAAALERSKALMPSLPVMELDLLYCAYLGKDKSGQGMHTKTIGRSPYGYVQGRAWKPWMPRIQTIIGGRLTEGSHGNAIGVGLCQFITRRFDEAVDWERTAVNCLSALTPNQAMRPIVCENDRDALELALAICPSGPRGVRAAMIFSTLEMTRILLTPAALEDVSSEAGARVIVQPSPLRFDAEGWLKLDRYWGEDH
ncbi:DUF2088 domain-containing protein [Paludisphaera rhizosphaerae]|uniref:DUF2088 domain-containing protein n=1 Tax=Paludisphaera rhizosphaerae TaxID=2711216 RepID=UPI0013EBD994|nr:DUF2088 domain-containing protein [Paludisphaera rhizosphaerae]